MFDPQKLHSFCSLALLLIHISSLYGVWMSRNEAGKMGDKNPHTQPNFLFGTISEVLEHTIRFLSLAAFT